MRKRILLFITTTLLLFSIFTVSVSADVFPKATLNMDITYVKDANIEVELLFKGEIDEDPYLFENDKFSEELATFLLEFKYKGFVSATIYLPRPFGIFQDSKTNGVFKYRFTYLYPKTFKVLLRDIDTNQVYISETITQSYFNSTMKLTIDKIDDTIYDELTVIDQSSYVKEDYRIFENSYKLLFRIILTVLIEIAILALFMYKNKKTYKIVGITNVITQVILNVFLMLGFLFSGIIMYILILILAEIIVIGIELVIYLKYVDEKPKGITTLYTILANAATIAVSFIPFLFF